MNNDAVTQKTAAARLRVSPKTVRRWLDAGVLEPAYIDGVRFVHWGSVLRYEQHTGELSYFLKDRTDELNAGSPRW